MKYKDQASYINRRYDNEAKPKLNDILTNLGKAKEILKTKTKSSRTDKLKNDIATVYQTIAEKGGKIDDLKSSIYYLADQKDKSEANTN